MTTLNDPLSIRDGHLHIEACDVVKLAEEFGTPFYFLGRKPGTILNYWKFTIVLILMGDWCGSV